MSSWSIPKSLLMLASVVIVGCTDSDSDSTAATTVSDPDSVFFAVSFDGNVCTAPELPPELPEGSYTFVLSNTSDRSDAALYFRTFADGHTFDEADAIHEAAGGDGNHYPRPDWIVPVAPDVRAEKLNDLDDNQTQYDPILPPGLNNVIVGTDSPAGIWICENGQFVVMPGSN